MKYLFSIQDLCDNETKLYTIEADNEAKAGDILAKKYMPLIPRVCFDSFTRALEELDLIVMSLGPMDSIEELYE